MGEKRKKERKLWKRIRDKDKRTLRRRRRENINLQVVFLSCAMAATQTEQQVLLEFVMNQEKTQVLYAESGKDFVDALFRFLTLPLGTIVRILKKNSITKGLEVGCLNSLYDSVAKLDEECFSTKACREMLLHPKSSAESYCEGLKLNLDDPTNYFLCQDYECRTGRKGRPLLSTIRNRACLNCDKLLNYQVHLKEEELCFGEHGSLKGKMTFIITDCLRVMSNSLVSSLNLLKEFGIDDIHSVHKMTVTITKEELLVCSFIEWDVDDGERINVKLIRKKTTGKILFAEGEEDFVNFILGFLVIPLGGVLHMMTAVSCMGSFDELYMSAFDLDETYFLWDRDAKKMLIDPQIAPHFTTKYRLLPIGQSPDPEYYFHEACGIDDLVDTVTTYHCTKYGVKRQKCELTQSMDPQIPYEDGYVEGPMLYAVADDLSVKAMSYTSALSMLEGVSDTPISDLEEVETSIGIREGLNILKASLITGSALTNGFSHWFSAQEEQVENEDENSISNSRIK